MLKKSVGHFLLLTKPSTRPHTTPSEQASTFLQSHLPAVDLSVCRLNFVFLRQVQR